MRNRPTIHLAVSLILALWGTLSESSAQTISGKLLGGVYAPEAAGARVAYIESTSMSCSGTLVGKRLVLTAAHCVAGDDPIESFYVLVGGSVYSVESGWYHAQYDPNAPFSQMIPYDLGMLVLKEDVNGNSPVPILLGRNHRKGQSLLVAGYGLNERGSSSSGPISGKFKIGTLKIGLSDGQLLYTAHKSTKTSICFGDSGGPASVLHGNHIALAGVASATSNGSGGGRCVLEDGGVSVYVNLESSASLPFLTSFEGVYYATWNDLRIAKLADETKPLLSQALKSRGASRLKRSLTEPLKSLRSASKIAAGERKVYADQAVAAIIEAQRAKSLPAAKNNTKAALRAVSSLSAMGII